MNIRWIQKLFNSLGRIGCTQWVFVIFPLLISTSGFSQITLELQPDGICGKDAIVIDVWPNANGGSIIYLQASHISSALQLEVRKRSFFEFNLSQIPLNGTVVSASLSLYFNGQPHSTAGGSNECYLQRITGAWFEDSVTWANQPPITTQNQVILPQSLTSSQSYLNIDVKDMVQDMVNNPSSSHGFAFRLVTEQPTRILNFASSDNSLSAFRPKLIVVYDGDVNNIILGNDTSLCVGENLLLDATISDGTYVWQDGSTLPTYNVTSAGMYWVETTTCDFILRDTVVVTYDTIASINLGNDTLLCIGETIPLDASILNGSYVWQDSSLNSVFTVTEPGIYWVEAVNGCGMARDSIQVSYQMFPGVSLGNDTFMCLGDTFDLEVVFPGAVLTWQDNSADSFFQVTETGLYWVTASLNGCSISDSIFISFLSEPEVHLGNDTLLCEGEILELSAWTLLGEYEWQDGSGNFHYTVSTPGLYWVEVTEACGSYRDSIQVNYNERPNPNLGSDTILCEGDILTLDVSSETGDYLWQDGSSASTYTITKPGIYYVEIANEYCTGIDTLHINYLTSPSFDLGVDTVLCAGDSLSFYFVDTVVSYLWQDGATSRIYGIQSEGTYWLEQTNACGTYIDSIEVSFDPCHPALSMPNVFTPNGDGTNDVFHPVHIENIQVLSFVVYDRWGIQSYYSKDNEITWDGNNRHKERVDAGTYFWVLRYTQNGNGKLLTWKGAVQLMR